jgi:hypothetical protein
LPHDSYFSHYGVCCIEYFYKTAANPTAMPQKPSSSLTLAPSPSHERLCGLAAVRTAAAIPVLVKCESQLISKSAFHNHLFKDTKLDLSAFIPSTCAF